jgi:Pyruvate/2-oxoacid:ferredoxin oxidoreductase delta subunit
MIKFYPIFGLVPNFTELTLEVKNRYTLLNSLLIHLEDRMDAQTPRKFSLVSEGTKKFIRASRQAEDFSFWDMVHGYIYARWPYYYIGIGKGDHPIAKYWKAVKNLFGKNESASNSSNNHRTHSLTVESGTFADNYHGKTLPLESAKKLVMVNEPLQVLDLEQVIPYVRARAILQEDPDHIVALQCPCRTYKENPCLPLEVCLIVGEPFASFVTEHHPDRSRKITQEEAAKILEQEDARGHVHHAFFKDAMLGRFYAICNCCECCCGAINSHKNGTPMLASSGYVAEINQDECLGCWTCEPYCQFGALTSVNGNSAVILEKCMGCGVCVNQCPEKAIELVLASEKGVPFEIEKLMRAVVE